MLGVTRGRVAVGAGRRLLGKQQRLVYAALPVAAPPSLRSLDEAQARVLAVAALERLGQQAISLSGGATYVSNGFGGVLLQARLQEDVLQRVLGLGARDVATVLDKSGGRQVKLAADGVTVTVPVDSQLAPTSVLQALATEVGFASLSASIDAPRAAPLPQCPLTPFEAPRLPVP